MPHTLLIDRSDRARIELSGTHAVATLNGLVTNDVAVLKSGHGQYASALTAKGKIVADMILLMLDDRIQVHASPASTPGLRAMFAKFVNPRFATLTDVSDVTGDITLVGESAAALIVRASGGRVDTDALSALPHFSFLPATIGGASVMVVHLPPIGASNECVYSAIMRRDALDGVRAALRDAGATDASTDVMDTLRIESGFPEWGVMTGSTTRRLQHFIDNGWRDSETDGWIDDVNPSDVRDVVALVPEGSANDAHVAATAAGRAFPAWRALTGPARAEYLYKWAAAIGDRAEELAQVMAREVGKPIGEARGEVGRCVVILRYYAGDAVRQMGDVIPAQSPCALQFSLREPLGVVAMITPWNFPLAIPLWKVAPALAFGILSCSSRPS